MNLVDFDSNSRDLVVSNQFWLYLVISVPLTAATLACWQYTLYKYRKSYLIGIKKQLGNGSTVDIEMA
jgi:hypothetical protein